MEQYLPDMSTESKENDVVEEVGDTEASAKRLSDMADLIRAGRSTFSSIDFDEVHQKCIHEYERTLSLLLEMETFLESNIDLFWEVDVPRVQRHPSDENYGWSMKRTPSNVTFFGTDIVVVFMDDGLHFVYNYLTNKVLAVSNNVGKDQRFLLGWERANSCMQYKEYKFFSSFSSSGLTSHAVFPSDGYTRFFNPCSGKDVIEKPTNTEWAIQILDDLAHDWKLANETYKCMVEAVERIERAEREYDSKFMELIKTSEG